MVKVETLLQDAGMDDEDALILNEEKIPYDALKERLKIKEEVTRLHTNMIAIMINEGQEREKKLQE